MFTTIAVDNNLYRKKEFVSKKPMMENLDVRNFQVSEEFYEQILERVNDIIGANMESIKSKSYTGKKLWKELTKFYDQVVKDAEIK